MQQNSEVKVIARKPHIIYYKRETRSRDYVLKIPQVETSQRMFLLNSILYKHLFYISQKIHRVFITNKSLLIVTIS
jgi:7,8-dihydro-6-hydroxymethylpterin-pyrophosphokinase